MTPAVREKVVHTGCSLKMEGEGVEELPQGGSRFCQQDVQER